MYLLNALFKFASYMFASLNIISPTSSLSIIINALLAYYYFNEKLTLEGFIGSALIMIGCVLSIIFGEHGQDSLTLNSLFKYANTKRFILFTTFHITMCFIFGVIGIYLVKSVEKKKMNPSNIQTIDSYIVFNDKEEKTEEIEEKDDQSIIDSESGFFEAITEEERNEYVHVLSCFLLAFTTSGLVAWVQMLGKISADLLWQSIFELDNQFTTITPFIIISMICVGLCAELYFISEIMRLFDAVLICPIYNSLFIFTTIAISAAYFRTFSNFSVFNLILFTIGLLFIIWGMLLLLYGQSKASMEHQNVDRKLSQRSRLDR